MPDATEKAIRAAFEAADKACSGPEMSIDMTAYILCSEARDLLREALEAYTLTGRYQPEPDGQRAPIWDGKAAGGGTYERGE